MPKRVQNMAPCDYCPATGLLKGDLWGEAKESRGSAILSPFVGDSLSGLLGLTQNLNPEV